MNRKGCIQVSTEYEKVISTRRAEEAEWLLKGHKKSHPLNLRKRRIPALVEFICGYWSDPSIINSLKIEGEVKNGN